MSTEAKFEILRLAASGRAAWVSTQGYAIAAWELPSPALTPEEADKHVARILEGSGSDEAQRALILTTWRANLLNAITPAIAVDGLQGPVNDDLKAYCDALQRRMKQAVINSQTQSTSA